MNPLPPSSNNPWEPFFLPSSPEGSGSEKERSFYTEEERSPSTSSIYDVMLTDLQDMLKRITDLSSEEKRDSIEQLFQTDLSTAITLLEGISDEDRKILFSEFHEAYNQILDYLVDCILNLNEESTKFLQIVFSALPDGDAIDSVVNLLFNGRISSLQCCQFITVLTDKQLVTRLLGAILTELSSEERRLIAEKHPENIILCLQSIFSLEIELRGKIEIFSDLIFDMDRDELASFLNSLKEHCPNALPYFLCALSDEAFNFYLIEHDTSDEFNGSLLHPQFKKDFLSACKITPEVPLDQIAKILIEQKRLDLLTNELMIRLPTSQEANEMTDTALMFFILNNFALNPDPELVLFYRGVLEAIPPYLLALSMFVPDCHIKRFVLAYLPFFNDEQLTAIAATFSCNQFKEALTQNKIVLQVDQMETIIKGAPLKILGEYCNENRLQNETILKELDTWKAKESIDDLINESKKDSSAKKKRKLDVSNQKINELIDSLSGWRRKLNRPPFFSALQTRIEGLAGFNNYLQSIKSISANQQKIASWEQLLRAKLPKKGEVQENDPFEIVACFTEADAIGLKVDNLKSLFSKLKSAGIQSMEDLKALGFIQEHHQAWRLMIYTNILPICMQMQNEKLKKQNWNDLLYQESFDGLLKTNLFSTLEKTVTRAPEKSLNQLKENLKALLQKISPHNDQWTKTGLPDLLREVFITFYDRDIVPCLKRYLNQKDLDQAWARLRSSGITTLSQIKAKGYDPFNLKDIPFAKKKVLQITSSPTGK